MGLSPQLEYASIPIPSVQPGAHSAWIAWLLSNCSVCPSGSAYRHISISDHVHFAESVQQAGMDHAGIADHSGVADLAGIAEHVGMAAPAFVAPYARVGCAQC